MRVSEIKGKTVITTQGENIGIVEDVLLRPMEQRLGALVVKSPRFAGPQILLAEDISGYGANAVPTQSGEKLKDQSLFGQSAQMVSLGEASGRRVATASGNYAGELTDVHIDPATGRVTGYEVTGGLFARMIGHTHTIESGEYTRLGKDLLIVADEVLPTPREEVVPTPLEAAVPAPLEKDVHGPAQ